MPRPAVVTTRLSRMQVNGLIDLFARNIKIRLDKTNSYIQIPGAGRISFTIPIYERKIGVAFVSFTWRSYPHDINSNRVVVSFQNNNRDNPNGSVAASVSFETEGQEIYGTIHADAGNMSVTLTLGLEVESNKVTYRLRSIRVGATLDIVDLEGVPDWVPGVGSLKNAAERKIKDEVKSRIVSILSRSNVRNSFADSLTGKVKDIIGRNRKIVSFVIRNDVVEIGHIPA